MPRVMAQVSIRVGLISGADELGQIVADAARHDLYAVSTRRDDEGLVEVDLDGPLNFAEHRLPATLRFFAKVSGLTAQQLLDRTAFHEQSGTAAEPG